MSNRIIRLLVLAATLALLMPLSPLATQEAALASSGQAPTDTWMVNNTYDESGTCTLSFCSLRQAIAAANSSEGADTIAFDIPTTDPHYNPTTGQWTIALQSPLPVLGDPAGTTIDARRFGSCSAYVIVDASSVSYGLEITATHNTISGLVIRNAQNSGLYIHGSGAQNNQLTCSYVVSNTFDGVRIAGGAISNTIGSATATLPNVISANGDDGIEITGSHRNTVVHNYIGTDEDGGAAWSNSGYGVRISGGAMTNTIGLAGTGGRNLISGNELGGVLISGSATRDNVVQNNYIGVNALGSAAIANLDAGVMNDGVVISSAPYNTIGPDNLISGHRRDGVRIEGGTAMYNVIKGNTIGADAAGLARVTNRRFGVWLQGEAHHNTIGTASSGNLISGNGYDGDFPVYGGVAMLGSNYNTLCANVIGTSRQGDGLPNGGPGVRLTDSAQHNAIGQGTAQNCANTIAWNEGDGIYVNGLYTLYNTIGRNSIHDNEDLGTNNESGGNRELLPPEIVKYDWSPVGTATLEGRTCLTCTVQVYSDRSGEGRTYEGQATVSNGRFNWQGVLSTGTAFTLVGTDANGSSSEFSASPVSLGLSIDDALPHVLVNKLPGDSDGPVVSTTVEYVATIVSKDPTLRKNLNLELRLSGGIWGSPTRVFTRTQAADYNGTLATWSSPSAGVYRVSGVNLLPNTDNATSWSQRVVFRFDIPPGTSPTPVVAVGLITATARTVNQGADWAALQVLKQAGEIIITNRTRLYAQYGVTETTTFLQNLYAFAQGSPANWSPSSVVYYVDAYSSTLASWNNTTVNYASESTANDAAGRIDALLEDWVEDSPTTYVKVCSSSYGCHNNPVDAPYLLIAGDDNIIPFYRRPDPTDKEEEYVCPDYCAPNTVLANLRNNDYFFTDNLYADLSWVFDEFPWDEGGVELATGRLVGSRASHMSTFLSAGQYGPSTANPAQAIVMSWQGRDTDEIATYLSNHGYDVLNDTESPVTVDDDDWRESYVLAILMQGHYQILHHSDHASEGGWSTPDDGNSDTGDSIGVDDVNGAGQANRIAMEHPIFTSNGCRSALPDALPNPNASGNFVEQTMVNAFAHLGASAVMGSTGISFSDPDEDDLCCGEEFVRDFWSRAARPPSTGTLNLGHALRYNKRYWDGHYSVDDVEEKTGGEFTLFGVPWVTAPYRVTSSPSPLRPAESDALSAPQAVAAQTFVVTRTFDASGYTISHVEGAGEYTREYDLVEVAGMPLAHDFGVPLVPLAEVELQLPLGATLLDVQVTQGNPVNLGTLNIPAKIPAVDIPGGDPGGLTQTHNIGVYPPQLAVSRTVSMDGYSVARVYASPLSYNTDPTSHQATLYRSLTLRITYDTSATVGLLSFAADPADLAPGQPFSARGTLLNGSDAPAAVTGTLRLANNLGQVVGVQALDRVVPPGEPFLLELGWTAPLTEGAYSLFLDLWQAGNQQAVGWQMVNVTGGRITSLTVPQGLQPGQEAAFAVTFANRRPTPFEGQVALSIYDAGGALVTTLSAPMFVGAGGQATADLFWDTAGTPAGGYVAAATVTGVGESVTYGVVQESFSLQGPQGRVFLPLVLRSS